MATIDDELTRSLPEARAAAEAAGQRGRRDPGRGPRPSSRRCSATHRPAAAGRRPRIGRLRSSTDRRSPTAGHPMLAPRVRRRRRTERRRSPPVPVPAPRPCVPAAADEPCPPAEHEATRHRAGHVDDGPEASRPKPAGAADHPTGRGEAPAIDETARSTARLGDALLDELTRPVVRRMKRLLTDEQNEVLDAVRRRRPLPSLDELLAPVAEHERRYAEATVPRAHQGGRGRARAPGRPRRGDGHGRRTAPSADPSATPRPCATWRPRSRSTWSAGSAPRSRSCLVGRRPPAGRSEGPAGRRQGPDQGRRHRRRPTRSPIGFGSPIARCAPVGSTTRRHRGPGRASPAASRRPSPPTSPGGCSTGSPAPVAADSTDRRTVRRPTGSIALVTFPRVVPVG